MVVQVCPQDCYLLSRAGTLENVDFVAFELQSTVNIEAHVSTIDAAMVLANLEYTDGKVAPGLPAIQAIQCYPLRVLKHV